MTAPTAKNITLNIIGSLLPPAIGVLCIRVLLNELGQGNVGIFTLALGMIGLTGLFDFGITKGITRYIAANESKAGKNVFADSTLAKCLAIMTVLGAVTGIGLWFLLPAFLKVSVETSRDTVDQGIVGFRAIAVSMPLAMLSIGIVGALEGRQNFVLSNAIRIPTGLLTYILPTIFAMAWVRLDAALVGLALARAIGCLLSIVAATSVFTLNIRSLRAKSEISGILKFSGWLSVSNTVGPLMVYGDRFYLASLLPPNVVATYTIPFDAVFRAMALPMAALNVLFPSLTNAEAKGIAVIGTEQKAATLLMNFWWPPMALATLLAHEVIHAWLGDRIAPSSADVLAILATGVFLNGFAQLPAATIHASGKSEFTAKFHLIQFAMYAPVLIVSVTKFGVLGAAAAWTGRTLVDLCMLYWGATRLRRTSNLAVLSKCLIFSCLTLSCSLLGSPLLRWSAAAAVGVWATWTTVQNWGFWRPNVLHAGGDA